MTYGKKFFACFNQNLTPLQKQEIQKGLDAGLSDRDVQSYASSAYNYLQMREIRLALEHSGDPKRNASLYQPSLEVEEMRKRRRKIARGERIRHFSFTGILVPVLLVLFLVCSAAVCLMNGRNAQPYLHLTRTEVTVTQGSTFEPMKYIADYSASGGELILPSDVNTASVGMKAAVYILRTPETEITRILNVEVIPAEK